MERTLSQNESKVILDLEWRGQKTVTLAEIRAEGTLRQVPGVGEAIAEKIEELLDTGKLGFYERLGEEVPESLLDLLEVPDMGPKRVGLVWRTPGNVNLGGLAAAAAGAADIGENYIQEAREKYAALQPLPLPPDPGLFGKFRELHLKFRLNED